jgi:O-antigen/teichoic acid export membrane protein
LSSALQSTTKFLVSQLNRERLRVWGVRSGLSILDQGLTSGAGFALNLLLARWLASEAYGAFAVAFATLIFLFGFHSALLVEPMSVVGPASYSNRMIPYFLAQLKLHATLVSALSILLLMASAAMARMAVHRELVAAMTGSALALPFVLLLWLVRRMCYAVQRPSMAVWGSAGYLTLVLIGLFALRATGWLNPLSAFLLMGTASIPAALLLLRLLGLAGVVPVDSCPWRQVLRENWNYGRWLVAGSVLFTVASQTQIYLVAALLGLGAAGILRAVQIPSLVMTQIITAVGLLALPVLATEFGLGRIDKLQEKAVLATGFLSAMAIAYAAVLGIFAKPIESLLFGGKFSSNAWLIPLLGLVPVCAAFAVGFSMALRALQKPHFDLLANAISAPIGLITAVLFIKTWGLVGAAVSVVAGFAAYALVFFCFFVRWTKQMGDIRCVTT